MNLPNAETAHVERNKVVAYLLAPDHPEGAGKAEFFVHFGFTPDAWEVLAMALLLHARTHPVSAISETQYGIKYQIEGSVVCPNGRSPSIRTVWIVNRGSNTPRLVTAHPF